MPTSAELLEKLIGFPTVSRDGNLDLVEFVANFLDDLGLQVELVHNAGRTKANLYAVAGPAGPRGVLLSGHTDVVPVDGQPWTRDPFRAVNDGGRVYGRGSADMKGFIACVLATLPGAVPRLARPLHLALSYDEEIGCVGIRDLLPRLAAVATPPAWCLVGEPTAMTVCTGHKGKLAGSCRCRGVAGHSALVDSGLNAIHLAVEMIQALRRIQAEVVASGGRDPDFPVPYSTLHVGTVAGGTTVNVIPDDCRFEFEIRHLPADNPDALLERLEDAAGELLAQYRDRFAAADIEFTVHNRYPGLDVPADDDAVAHCCRYAGDATLGKLSYGTEGGLFHDALDVPVVVCGPGSMQQGHKADEYVELEQLARCEQFLDRLVADLG